MGSARGAWEHEGCEGSMRGGGGVRKQQEHEREHEGSMGVRGTKGTGRKQTNDQTIKQVQTNKKTRTNKFKSTKQILEIQTNAKKIY